MIAFSCKSSGRGTLLASGNIPPPLLNKRMELDGKPEALTPSLERKGISIL
jgi:hypothetical protein